MTEPVTEPELAPGGLPPFIAIRTIATDA
jgi:hypothetical protein